MPKWRHNGTVKMVKKTEMHQPRTNLRLSGELLMAVDDARSKRPGKISRNTWITEAILEKLERIEKNDGKDEL